MRFSSVSHENFFVPFSHAKLNSMHMYQVVIFRENEMLEALINSMITAWSQNKVSSTAVKSNSP